MEAEHVKPVESCPKSIFMANLLLNHFIQELNYYCNNIAINALIIYKNAQFQPKSVLTHMRFTIRKYK